MRLGVAALAGVLFAFAVPALADPVVDQRLADIRQHWTKVGSEDGQSFYISPEIPNAGSPTHTYDVAEIYDAPITSKDFPSDPPSWGYLTTREYDCQSELVWVRRSGMILLEEITSNPESLGGVRRSAISTASGKAYFAHACGG